MRTPNWLICILFFSGLVATVSARTETQWRVIEQPMFELIYEANIESQAQRVVAQLNHYLTAHLSEMPVNKPIKPIPIVLYSRAHTSNGNVGLVPFQSRWFNRPAPFAQLEWYDALAVHEGRHIIQFDQLSDNPVANILSTAFGDLGTGAFAGLFLPTWFLEGDAITSETLMTAGGRGRVASFDLWYRTDLQEHNAYQYDRAMLGTGFDRTPYQSPYVLGRYLVAYLRNEYGSDIFDRVINRLAMPMTINFDGAIKKETGASLSTHYRNMTQILKSHWQSSTRLANTPVTVLSEFRGQHWQSFYPVAVTGENIYALKVDAKQGSALVSLNNQNEANILPITNRIAANYYGGSKTAAIVKHNEQWCWVEEKPGALLPYRETADLYCWDGFVERKLSNGERFTYVGSNQKQFLLNRFNTDRSSQLVLLDKRGGLLQAASLPENSIAYDIKSAGTHWLYVLAGSQQDGIYKIDEQLEDPVLLKANVGETLRSPTLTQNWLLYISDRSGIDQVYSLNLQTNQEYQVSTRPYGSYFLQWDKTHNRIVMADYTAQGQQIVSMPFSDDVVPNQDWLAVENTERNTPIFMDELKQYPAFVYDPAVAPSIISQPYSMVKNLINVHSWRAFYNGDQFNASITSDDTLEKLTLNLGAGYDQSANDWTGLASATYRSALGTAFSIAFDKSVNADDESYTDSWLIAEKTPQQYFGINQSSWHPYVGFNRYHVDQKDPLYRVLYGIGYQRQQEKAFQAINTPSGFSQDFSGQYYLSEQTFNWLSDTKISFQGFHSRDSIDVGYAVQHLSYPESLLQSSTLFGAIEQAGFSSRGEASYRINLGAVGRSFTPLLYWRNTDVTASMLSQQVGEQTQRAFGLSVAPSMNVLRNSNIKLQPSVSLYYLTGQEQFNLKYQVTLGGF